MDVFQASINDAWEFLRAEAGEKADSKSEMRRRAQERKDDHRLSIGSAFPGWWING